MGSITEELNIVTGAFGYTGKYIAQRLLAAGKNVKTLTNHPPRQNPFGRLLSIAPLDFNDERALAHSLVGASVLYNTYWVRFAHGSASFEQAVANTKTLIRAAESAGLRRIVHVSIANPSLESPLPYYRGKAELEQTISNSRLSYAILRPTVIFGPEDILINNIAWMLRKFPVFAVPGRGDYGVQPIFVEDMADLAISASQANEKLIFDAVGPERFTFDEMVTLIGDRIGRRARLVHVPPGLSMALTGLVGLGMRDVILTREEIEGLMSNLLVSSSTPTGTTKLSDWLTRYGANLGRQYSSELNRHYR